MQEVKALQDYSFSELVDLHREQFDTVLAKDTSNITYLTNLRKLISVHYDSIKLQMDLLSEMANTSTDSTVKDKCISTIKDMYFILFSLEYKACAINNKVKKLTVQMT